MRSATLVSVLASVLLLASVAQGQGRRLTASAVEQIQALDQEKQGRTPTQRKIDSRLLYTLYRHRGDARLAALPSLRIVSPEQDGRILVDVDLVSMGGLKPVMQPPAGNGRRACLALGPLPARSALACRCSRWRAWQR